jgi:hypothetical protein
VRTDAAAVLESGELEVIGLLPRASNSTFLARAHGPDGALPVVYKPRAGETPLWDFPDGTLCSREVAAAVMATAPPIDADRLREDLDRIVDQQIEPRA